MKVKIPFKMFEKTEGELELEFSISEIYGMDKESIEEVAKEHAMKAGQYLGSFRDELQRVILGYERVPGIGILFWKLNQYRDDEILRDRLTELLKEAHTRRKNNDSEDD